MSESVEGSRYRYIADCARWPWSCAWPRIGTMPLIELAPPPARHGDRPPARTLVGLRGVAPVDRRIVYHPGDTDRHLRPEEPRALGARLEQQHSMPAALRQPARDDRARGPGAGDDVVVGWIGLHWCALGSLDGEGSSLGGR